MRILRRTCSFPTTTMNPVSIRPVGMRHNPVPGEFFPLVSYLGKVFARGIVHGGICRMQEWTSGARLAGTLTEEFAGNMFCVCGGIGIALLAFCRLPDKQEHRNRGTVLLLLGFGGLRAISRPEGLREWPLPFCRPPEGTGRGARPLISERLGRDEGGREADSIAERRCGGWRGLSEARGEEDPAGGVGIYEIRT